MLCANPKIIHLKVQLLLTVDNKSCSFAAVYLTGATGKGWRYARGTVVKFAQPSACSVANVAWR